MARTVLAAALLLVPGLARAAGTPDAIAAVEREVGRLERGDSVVAFGAELHGSDVLSGLYRRHGFQPAWSDHSSIDDVLRAIDHAGEQGLDPRDYHREAIASARPHAGDDESSAARFDLLVTSSLVELAYDVRYGRVPASHLDRATMRSHKLAAGDPVDDLGEAIDTGRLHEFVESLEPRTPFYHRLQQALADYRRLAAAGGWPLVPTGPSLKPEARDARVAVVRERLAVTGELPSGGSTAPADLYDDATIAAVKTFQERHGLAADGVLGAQTVSAMRVTAAARVEQVRATLERCRWFLRDLPERYVMVNAAGFRVLLIEDGQVKWRSRAIVGKPLTSTPMFRADMRSILLNPTWTVPTSIVRNEFLPEMQHERSFLAKRHITVVDGEYVQAAGPDNALGRIKLNLPNPYSIYLHDTPSRSLFSNATRAFSHGCVRVENPVQLAALALDDPQWTVEALDAAINTGKTRSIPLKKPLPVFVMYWTVTVDREGRVEFFPDLYGRDAEILHDLEAVR